MKKNNLSFGELLKGLRIKQEMTLREACKNADYDPSNWSKIERSVLPAPSNKGTLERWAKMLKIKKNTEKWREFFDLAELSQGRIPKDILQDEKILNFLPAFFRTIRGQKPDEDDLTRLIDLIKKTNG